VTSNLPIAKQSCDGDAARESLDFYAADIILWRIHHELSGGQGHHLRANIAILKGGTRLQL
jgi:hypothetical protein